MIASLRGRPVARTLDGAVLDVGGVGYALRLTLRALRKIEGDEEVTLDTYLHVREDTLQLYGFAEAAEREIFEHLLSVSGVGPRWRSRSFPARRRAGICGARSPSRTSPGSSRFPASARRPAERVVLELKEKLGVLEEVGQGAVPELMARDGARRAGLLADRGRTCAGHDRSGALARGTGPAGAEGRLTEQFLAPAVLPGRGRARASLRPRSLDEFVGQERVKEQLGISLEATRARGEALDHVLLVGPPGLGKTSLAYIVREELGVGIRCVAGPALERKGDMAAILTAMEPRDVLFIDEIHR